MGEIYASYAVSLKPHKMPSMHMVKNQKLCSVNHATVYCLTPENAYFTNSVNNHFYGIRLPVD